MTGLLTKTSLVPLSAEIQGSMFGLKNYNKITQVARSACWTVSDCNRAV